MTKQLCSRICFKAHMWKSSWSLVGADPQPSPPSSSVGPDDPAFLSDLSSCDILLWVWYLCLQTSDRIIITHVSPGRGFPSRRGRGSVQVPAGTGTLLRSDCGTSRSVNIWWLYFSSVGILPFSGEQTFALPSFQYWATRERWWLLLHTKGLKGI